LDFIDKARRISYAASFGVAEIPRWRQSHYKRYLPQFAEISVREEQAAELIKQMIGRQVKVVLDPTLLLDQAAWNQLADKEERKKSPNGGILCYCLGPTKAAVKIIQIAKELSRRMGDCPILMLSSSSGGGLGIETCREICQKENVDFAVDVTPMDFVSSFANSAYVLTNSFHGTAFSIIYRKPFMTLLRPDANQSTSTNSRIENITSLLGLSERLLPFDFHATERALNLTLDYTPVEPLFERMRQESLQYLQNALESVTKNQ